MAMNLAQARLLLATNRDRNNTAKGALDEIDTMVKSFQAAMRLKINGMEGMLRDNSRDLALMAGSGINTEDIQGMRQMYATALENSDRARALVGSVEPIKEWTRNIRANLSVIETAIQRNQG